MGMSRRRGGEEGQRDRGTEGQRDKGTKGQRDRGTKGKRDKGTKGQSWRKGKALGERLSFVRLIEDVQDLLEDVLFFVFLLVVMGIVVMLFPMILIRLSLGGMIAGGR